MSVCWVLMIWAPQALFPSGTRHRAAADTVGDPRLSSLLYLGDSPYLWPTHTPCWSRSNAWLVSLVTRMKQGVPASRKWVLGPPWPAVRKARRLERDKLSFVTYRRNWEKENAIISLVLWAIFPSCFPPREVWTPFYLERCIVTFSIILSTY